MPTVPATPTGVTVAALVFLAAVAGLAVPAARLIRRRLQDEADRLAELADLGHLADWPIPGHPDPEAALDRLLDAVLDRGNDPRR